MITVKDLVNIFGNKMANDTKKSIIRNCFPPQVAEQMCTAIDCNEEMELFQKLDEWQKAQQNKQQAVQSFLQQYYYGR